MSHEKLHKDLETLHEKISRLECRLKVNRDKEPSAANTSKSRFEGELTQLLEKKDTLSVSTTRAMATERGKVDSQIRCPSARANYTSIRSLLSKATQKSIENKENKENVNDVQNKGETLMDANESQMRRSEIVIQTKHEVLMQLTSSLEEERKKTAEYKKEIELWKKRATTLESKYTGLKCEYDELVNNYTTSERLRKKQKHLLRDLKKGRTEECASGTTAVQKKSAKPRPQPVAKTNVRGKSVVNNI